MNPLPHSGHRRQRTQRAL